MKKLAVGAAAALVLLGACTSAGNEPDAEAQPVPTQTATQDPRIEAELAAAREEAERIVDRARAQAAQAAEEAVRAASAEAARMQAAAVETARVEAERQALTAAATANAAAAAAVVPAPRRTTQATEAPQAAPASGGDWANCTEVKAAGAAPIRQGDAGFKAKFDRDGDGVGCES